MKETQESDTSSPAPCLWEVTGSPPGRTDGQTDRHRRTDCVLFVFVLSGRHYDVITSWNVPELFPRPSRSLHPLAARTVIGRVFWRWRLIGRRWRGGGTRRENFYKVEGAKDALICGNSSDAGEQNPFSIKPRRAPGLSCLSAEPRVCPASAQSSGSVLPQRRARVCPASAQSSGLSCLSAELRVCPASAQSSGSVLPQRRAPGLSCLSAELRVCPASAQSSSCQRKLRVCPASAQSSGSVLPQRRAPGLSCLSAEPRVCPASAQLSQHQCYKQEQCSSSLHTPQF
ncbi:hypothetical protein WMY93_034197 [Mugilogobius chulae]|uniref:Ubiquitinyl hydrolase 1 n=1 Tax=Mugilogobius chulae TaxID=88201 RepID=A0AAW0MR43_9GOBI